MRDLGSTEPHSQPDARGTEGTVHPLHRPPASQRGVEGAEQLDFCPGVRQQDHEVAVLSFDPHRAGRGSELHLGFDDGGHRRLTDPRLRFRSAPG